MTLIKPFRALRPRRPEQARQVSCVPYDVCSREELQALVEDNPYSFLRVTRAEAEVAPEVHSENQAVFELARRNLQSLIDEGILRQDAEESFYVYRLSSETQSQTGVVACCSLDEYEAGLIKKHEKVRPDKVKDRTRHIVTVRAQTGLIFLAYRGTEKIDRLVSGATAAAAEPLYDFVCSLGVRHQIWRVSDTEPLAEAFAEVPALYIADGHHRIAAADLARRMWRMTSPDKSPAENYNYVVAGIFPARELRILPYNRVVRDLNGLTEAEFLGKLGESFTVKETGRAEPRERGAICVYLPAGGWHEIRLSEELFRPADTIHALDVSILQDFVLKPVLGIENVQTDERIEFVGGVRGTGELERLVDSGKAQVAFSMFPTSIEDLFTVSDAGEIMPPKSTWFEPKLRDGLLVHML